MSGEVYCMCVKKRHTIIKCNIGQKIYMDFF